MVGHHVLDLGFAEEHEGRTPELNHDMRIAAGQAFAGAQVEWNSRPAPVVDQESHGDEGFRARIRRHSFFGAVGGHTLVVHDAFSVLAADDFAEHILIAEGLDGMQNFGLLVTHRVRLE